MSFFRRNRNLLISLFVFCLLYSTVAANRTVTADADGAIQIKVMHLSMFEIGANTGDFPGEFQFYYDEFFKDGATAYNVKGAPNPFFVNAKGVAGTVTGMGKARSGATLMAILLDPRFDFSKTYFITTGCSGVAPDTGTIGDVFICDWVVDFDLGHAWRAADDPGSSKLYRLGAGYADNGSIKLNKELADWAYGIVKDIKLEDSDEAINYRKNYPQAIANEKPKVRGGFTSVTGDNYWHGATASLEAKAKCNEYGASPYGVTQMEDNAFAVVLRSLGYLDRYIIVRDTVNFDQPYPGQSVVQSLDASSGAFYIGRVNNHRVGSALIHELLKRDFSTWTLPGCQAVVASK